MNCFPLFIELTNKPVLIIGGGKVALRKIEKLLPFGAQIHVIAPEICDEIRVLRGLILDQRAYESQDIDQLHPVFVIAATNNRMLNQQISGRCMELRIPINVVDDPSLCTFLFPSLISRDSLTIGISTGGKSPTAARELRSKIEETLPAEIESILDEMSDYRDALKVSEPDAKKRAEALTRRWHELTE